MWGALIGAGAGLLGSVMDSKANKKAAENAGAPWSGAKPYVTQGYADAQGALNSAMDMGAYSGDRTAGMNPWQTAGLNTMGNFGANQGISGAETVFGSGMNNIGNASQFGGNAASMFAQAGQDPTQQIIQNAGSYANNPFLDGQIDAASRDVTRNLNENQLTGLDLAASGSGNMNSSRTGVAQGIMQRGAADRIGDISSQMRGAAYQNGLGMSQDQYNTGMNQGLNANGQLLQAGQFGADQIGNGINLGYGAGSAMNQAGAGFQNQAQNEINGQMAAHTDKQNNSLDLLGKYMGIINGNFQTGGTAQPTNTFGNVVSGALGGAALGSQWNKSTTPAPVYGKSVDSLGTTGAASAGLMDRVRGMA